MVTEASELYGALRDALPEDVRRFSDEPLAALFWDWLEDRDEDLPFRPVGGGREWRTRGFRVPDFYSRSSSGGDGMETVGREVRLGPDAIAGLRALWDFVDPDDLEAAAGDALAGHDWTGAFDSPAALTDYLCDWAALLEAADDRGWGVWIEND